MVISLHSVLDIYSIRSLRDIHPNQYYRISGKTTKTTKTFYIESYDNEGEPLEKFEEHTMYDEDDFCDFMKSVYGKGLESIDDKIHSIYSIPTLFIYLFMYFKNSSFRILN